MQLTGTVCFTTPGDISFQSQLQVARTGSVHLWIEPCLREVSLKIGGPLTQTGPCTCSESAGGSQTTEMTSLSAEPPIFKETS